MDGLRYLPTNKASILNCLNILVQRTVKILRVVFSLHHIPPWFPGKLPEGTLLFQPCGVVTSCVDYSGCPQWHLSWPAIHPWKNSACHSGLARKRSGGIHPSCKNNLRMGKIAAWEDPSTPFHFGRDDMSVGGSVQPHRLYLQRGGRQIAEEIMV